MSSIVHGIFEIFQGIANTIVGIVTTIVNVVVGAVQGAINLIWGAISTLLNGLYHVAATAGDIVGHAGSFVMHNIIPIAVVVALLVGFSAMQARSGGGGLLQGKKRA